VFRYGVIDVPGGTQERQSLESKRGSFLWMTVFWQRMQMRLGVEHFFGGYFSGGA